ncbi:LysM peptidoglycan-binding domain-containing protein [Piscinibacter terrae]|uniref:LysM domain-containing protein n=1 Tax=Piscinibacter terrae TaxID=2496871 RepID=A0A3N7HSW8_9BURK|nr:LysM domain-containing protein [Albitalea terrae]RQP25390.1 LysM domain-containing protein [Albitalea terrae]
MSNKLISTHRLAALFAAAGLLAACQQVPTAQAPQQPPAPAPAPGNAEPESQRPVTPAAPASPATQQQATKIAVAAAVMLENGHEEQAKSELQRALAADPNNKLALNLMRQITADPVATLGRESFAYTVRPNDSMSSIAGRFMGDIYSFYILARYNSIAVPKQVSGGQVLRIPGKAPPPSVMRETAKAEPAPPPPPPPPPAVPAPPPPPAEPTPGERAMRAGALAQKSGDFERALAEYSKAATLDQPGAEGKATEVRKQLVSRYTLNARTAFAKQDLDGAIRSWERVLAVDPNNETAKLERQRALSLKEKVKGLGT